MIKNLILIFRRHLIAQVFVAILCGVFVGIMWPHIATQLKFISVIFINLIKLIVSPLIFVSIIIGICQHQHAKGIGNLAVRTLIYFEVMSVVAILLAVGFMLWLEPGAGFNTNEMYQSDISPYLNKAASSAQGWSAFVISIFPDSILGVLAGHNLLPVIVLSILFSLALLRMPQRAGILQTLSVINELLFGLINIIVRLSPLAAFGAISSIIGEQGVGILVPLGKLILTILLIMITFCCLLTAVGYAYGVKVWELLKHIREELMIAFGASSSESVFPQLMVKLESFGCSKSVVGFVLPTGYAFNLDGTAIYVVAGAMFIQQVYGIPFTWSELFILLSVILVTSKGAAGVTGSGFITLAATLSAIPGHLIPLEGLALLLGIDRIMSDVRTMCNLFGNSVGTVIIAKAQEEFDPPKDH